MITIPKYGDTVVDAAGRTGVAKFDPNTGAALPNATVPVPTSTPTPTVRTPGLLEEAKKSALMTEETASSIKQQADQYAASQRQARIDAINTTFAPRIQREKEAGDARMSRVAALNFNTGTVGSGVDTTRNTQQKNLNEDALRAIEEEKALKINDAFLVADQLGASRQEQLIREKQGIAESNVAYYQGLYDKATEALKMFGNAEVSLDDLKKADPATYQTLKDVSGLTDFEIATRLDQAKPKPDLKVSFQDGVVVAYGTDPKTGKPIAYSQKVEGIPDTYKPTFAPDGSLLMIPENFDGDVSKIKTIGNYAKPEKADSDGTGGYTAKQLSALTKINENVSKNATYAKTTNMRGYVDNVVTSLSQATGVGDLAAINQFQKVIDEGAVTRDQDVALIQSSQSLLNTLKTKAKKLEKGEQLSPELRTQMRTAVEMLYQAQVKALSKDPYIKAKTKEASIYGLGAEDTILAELGGFSDGTTGNSDAEIAELKAQGYTDEQIQELQK